MAKKSEKDKARERKASARKRAEPKSRPKKVKINPWMVSTLALVVITGLSIGLNWNITGFFAGPVQAGTGTRSDFGTSGSAATLDLFVMSQCPYGVQAESGVLGALSAFGDDLQVNIRFIVSGSGSSFSSLHGQPELDEDLRQLCIIQNYPEKYFEYLSCFIPSYSNAATQFDLCADQLGIDKSLITGCMDDEATIDMLMEDIALESELGVRGSPTYYINGEIYSGGRDASSLQSYICNNIDSSLSGCTAQVSGTAQQPTGSC